MKNGLFFSVFVLLLSASWAFAQQPEIQYYRPWDKTGINGFEPSKSAAQPAYTGFKIRIGGAFTQDFQSITHSNVPTYKAVSPTNKTNANLLYNATAEGDSTDATLSGFNLAMANLNLDFQIEDGIRVCLENYMSSRHHSEFWVKGGYIQIDKLPMFGNPQWYTDHLRVKIGHFQPNFGDMQFRRTDGGNTMYNPFVENYIMDAFSTEIGGEVYAFFGPVMGMVGITSGFINGNVNQYPTTPVGTDVEPTEKKPSIFLKLAFDKQVNPNLRLRLSGSYYMNPSIQRNTLYAGDRTGSHYFLAMEPALTAGVATAQGSQFTSGRFDPRFSNEVSTFMINPFVKFYGLEFFGAYEKAKGRLNSERDGSERDFTQMAAELLYRFGSTEQFYLGGRYVQLTGTPFGFTDEVKIDRLAIAAGWFPSKNLLLKGEYVVQNFKDFPVNDYRNEGKFNGFVVEAVIGF
ncbi:MAG: hypothetical protein IPM81_01260 [Saprospirales bacterium]|nr:hypothetical protein [Saprospirales bacterium]